MNEMENAVIVDFPLRGEWVAVNTPARRIPSHGTDILGQRYAYDFVKMEKNKLFKGSSLAYLFLGIPTKNSFCHQENIYAVSEGEVVVVREGLKENKRLNPFLDTIRAYHRAMWLSKQMRKYGEENIDLHRIIGNHVILKHDGYYSAYAHIHPGTITVKLGQQVKKGELLGKVGHTGNSTAPHLHFQLMDSLTLLKAKGIPCAFREMELMNEGKWSKVTNVVPEYQVPYRG